MIELKRLSMAYDLEDVQLDVLREIDLTIDDGESIAIVGPSGSGKTTQIPKFCLEGYDVLQIFSFPIKMLICLKLFILNFEKTAVPILRVQRAGSGIFVSFKNWI